MFSKAIALVQAIILLDAFHLLCQEVSIDGTTLFDFKLTHH